MAVFVPELSDEELVEQIERVTGYITDQQGVITEVLRESPWGRRRLAYTIRFNSVDYRDGIYVVYHFDNVPSGVFEIERELKLDIRVMRYLLVHDDPLAGEKDTGQHDEAVEGEDVAAEGEATTEATAAPAEEATAPVEEVAATDEAPAPAAEPESVEEAPVEAQAAPAEDAPAEVEPVVEVEVETEAPAEVASSSDEDTKED
jgi:small subunit ribosomal protein S6